MLEQLDSHRTLDKPAYRKAVARLQRELFELQRRCWEHGLGVLIVFEGWSAAGKGKAIRRLTRRLEPRAYEIHSVHEPRTHESHLPWLYRFWRLLPSHGKLAVFDHSWYRRTLIERIRGEIDDVEYLRSFDDINSFERTLSDDRYAIVKLFLHIDKEEQAKRLERLAEHEHTEWRVRPRDRQQNEAYEEYLIVTENMLARTETEWAPWTLVEAQDGRFARVKIFETVISRLEDELESHVGAPVEAQEGRRARFDPPTLEFRAPKSTEGGG